MARTALLLLALGACNPDQDIDEPIAPPVIAPYADSAPLTDLGREAIALAPAWLRADLGLALRQQEAARADELAALIVDAALPSTIDEIAFAIAHTSPEVLGDEDFHAELLSLNAELIYAHDAELDYVELVETGVAGEDDDFWTTATYQYLGDEGQPSELTVDRDIYYWFVVHPKIEDESPWFIDAWDPCGSHTLECAADPDTGWFWREFLWDVARDTCPVEGHCPTLDTWLPGVPYVWNGLGYGDAEGAIREIVEFTLSEPVEGYRWLVFGAYDERSIQPNRIYGLGRGNCGEWADMSTALARTGLIPNANASPASWDHTWNAFYDGSWVEWEPVNFWIDHAYGAPFSNYITRGDGLVLLQTPDYTDQVFTMEIEVVDAEDVPVPGASVSVWSPWVIHGTEYWSYAGEAPTNEEGVATFPLVALQRYAIRVETPIGSWPVEEGYITYASRDVDVGETDVKRYALEATLPTGLQATEVGFEGRTEATLTISFTDPGARTLALSQRFGTTYTVEAAVPEIEGVLVDGDNLALLEAGEPFEAAWIGPAADAEVDLPLDHAWYLVLSNASQMSTAVTGTLTVALDPLDAGAWEEAATPLDLPYELLPGGHLAVSLAPAER
ncbi:MAG: carboxypeptidase regulatory-like domain-containing protein [Deltaproteobacteria bacterium]|nr:carboxypeptidase regulatory-like domain-containing protein [Deltaproteobacteria bacterium]